MANDVMPAFRRGLTMLVADPDLHDFTVRQLALLMRLAEMPKNAQGPSTGELAREFGAAKPNITRAVRRLSDEGYVVQVPSPLDARKAEISATAAGRALVARVARVAQAA